VNRTPKGGLAVVIAATSMLAIGCGSRVAPIATAETQAIPLDATTTIETRAATSADTATNPNGLTEADLDDLERTLNELETMVDELEQELNND
jgi:hypothetical protein